MLKTDRKLQDTIESMSQRVDVDSFTKVCDFYHERFKNPDEAVEWGFLVGKYIGEFFKDDAGQVWKFELHYGTTIYFIGELEKIRRKIYKVT